MLQISFVVENLYKIVNYGVKIDSPAFPNTIFTKINISKTFRYKLEVNMYSHRVSFALSEYNFTWNFGPEIIEKLVFKV